MAACGTDERESACFNCAVNPAVEVCCESSLLYLAICRTDQCPVTCCDSVELSSADSSFLSSVYSVFAGTYNVYSHQPTYSDRTVYKLDGKVSSIEV